MLTCLAACAAPARAAGIFDAINTNDEVFYSLGTTKTTDASGRTFKQDTVNYGVRTNVRVNYNLLPKLNVNAGTTFDKSFFELSGDTGNTDTELTQFRPYIWLTVRDPIFSPAIGYDRAEDTTKVSGQAETSLIRDTYNGILTWRPSDLPYTQFRYTHTAAHDNTERLLDSEQDQYFVKTEYIYGGFNGYYSGNFLQTTDHVNNAEATQLVNEIKALYSLSLLDNRVTLTTDNRLRFSDLTTRNGVPSTIGLSATLADPVTIVAAFTAPRDVPTDLKPNTSLITGTSVDAGLQIAPSVERPTIVVDFGTTRSANRFFVTVGGFPGQLPLDVANAFTWQVFTSPTTTTVTNVSDLTFNTLATASATFSPLDGRFQLDFPGVTTRYMKIVVQPLPAGAIAPDTKIVITRIEAFFDRTAGAAAAGVTKFHVSETFRYHTFEARVALFRTPSVYYRLSGDYQEFEPEGRTRYTISNGLFLTHPLSRIFTVSANGTYDITSDRGKTGNGYTYYASLTATPLRTLTDSLVFSGNRQFAVDATTTSNSVVLYNTAQLYRGIDMILNLGGVLTSEEVSGFPELDRREVYVNIGATVTPHPSLSMNAYYLGKLTHSSGGPFANDRDTTENRFDVGASFSPFRTLVISASANILTETDQKTQVLQNYGLSWAPFPDGNLQFAFFYAENRLPDDVTSRTIQPTLRWYFSSRRKSYLELTYQKTTTDQPSLKIDSEIFSTRLNLLY